MTTEMTGLQNLASKSELKSISYKDDTQTLNGLVSSNAGQELPGVLILPAWYGIDDEAKNAALELDKQGYIAFIADIYGEGNIPKDLDEASKLSRFYKQNHQEYQKRISLALKELKQYGAVQGKIAVIGYCFGGTGALEAARGNLPLTAAVSIHGGLAKAPDRKNNSITSKILVLHPADDATVSKEDYDRFITEMNDANADWQIISYGNSKHTFTNPKSPDYNPIMANRAWEHTLMFLKNTLK